MSQHKNNELDQIRSQLSDIHKLLFSHSPKKADQDMKNKFKSEILLGVNKRR